MTWDIPFLLTAFETLNGRSSKKVVRKILKGERIIHGYKIIVFR